MKVGVDERGLVIEAIATLAYRKSDMVNFILNPAGVPKEIHQPLAYKRDDRTGRPITKRHAAPLILQALEERSDYSEIVGNIVSIAASWERFELSNDRYAAQAVKAQARDILKRNQELEAEEAASREAARREQDREYHLARNRELSLLLAMFDELAVQDYNPQKRGYGLQDLLNRLFLAL